jgi:hypothetical protein
MRIRTERKRVFSALSKALARKTAECLQLVSQNDSERKTHTEVVAVKDREIESLKGLQRVADDEMREALSLQQKTEISQIKAKYEIQLRKSKNFI